MGREIISRQNKRNIKILVLFSMLFFANIFFDHKALNGNVAADGYGARWALTDAFFLLLT
ncbi:hypothetical protein MEG_01938 [Bartonella tamiae Th307]|uniref:Uncharacterized protein n=2 Tax=Bartonella tamiae TaxID=373638 RepID=J1JWH5_9HYPH|nr:hypothetical protein ME5_01918 [Bartonella tamiae Th239]EJF92768.1 hypothetical protein MEG_01938 [Bartonella tamiae Th307]